MNRVIKFRAWDGYRMTTSGIQFIATDGILTGKLYGPEGNEQDMPIMQFTGLCDQDGKEIYEGDVVQFTYWWFDGNVAESTLTGTIVYSNHSMSFQLKGVKNKEWEQHTGYENDSEYLAPFSELNFDGADFSVIGNIFEHPELLEQSK